MRLGLGNVACAVMVLFTPMKFLIWIPKQVGLAALFLILVKSMNLLTPIVKFHFLLSSNAL